MIKSWLGHVSITTTSEYIEIDMAMKRKAIERCPPWTPTGFVDTIRSGTMVYEERTGSGTGP